MTIQKIEFDYDIPDGYRFVRYGYPNDGEQFLSPDGSVVITFDSGMIKSNRLIVEKIPEQESKKHRWHDLMIEFANDKTIKIEYFNTISESWENAPKNPSFYECVEYRKKPTKKIVRFRNYLKEDGYVGVLNINIKSNAPGFKEWIGDWQEVEI